MPEKQANFLGQPDKEISRRADVEMTPRTSDRQFSPHRDQNTEVLAFINVEEVAQATQRTEAKLHRSLGQATLTKVKAWCYHLDVTTEAVRCGNIVRSTSVVRASRASLLSLFSDRSGAIQLEYTILLGLVGLSSAAAFVLLGIALVDSFGFVRGMLLTPFP